jgi:FkbM family methyltransferase
VKFRSCTNFPILSQPDANFFIFVNSASDLPVCSVSSDALRYPKQEGYVRHIATDSEKWQVHDSDFHFLGNFRGEARLMLDVGAAHGNSVFSALAVNPDLHIISFEANPGWWPVLQHIQDAIPEKFELRRFGLSQSSKTLSLYIPEVGNEQLIYRASTLLESFKCQYFLDFLTSEHPGQPCQILETQAEFRNCDELGLEPWFIKIDVEGAELDVLQGMCKTLSCRPIIMCENGALSRSVDAFLAKFGYSPFSYNHVENRLSRFRNGSPRPLNSFYFTNDHLESEPMNRLCA